jgi:hypothetical protein
MELIKRGADKELGRSGWHVSARPQLGGADISICSSETMKRD